MSLNISPIEQCHGQKEKITWIAEKILQRPIEDVEKKPPANARAGDNGAGLKSENARSRWFGAQRIAKGSPP
jgi:hypothetical protein